MNPIEIKPEIYWVGGIDWDIRTFHGYVTQRGFAFGSYGWGGQAIKEIETVMKTLDWETALPSINIQYLADEQELNEVEKPGQELGTIIK